jgi:hypothetical protein
MRRNGKKEDSNRTFTLIGTISISAFPVTSMYGWSMKFFSPLWAFVKKGNPINKKVNIL